MKIIPLYFIFLIIDEYVTESIYNHRIKFQAHFGTNASVRYESKYDTHIDGHGQQSDVIILGLKLLHENA